MTAIRTLCNIIAQRAKVNKSLYSRDTSLNQLIDAGLIEDNGVMQATVCSSCFDTHAAEIMFENDTYGFFCPSVGFTALDRKEIEAVVPCIPTLISMLADLFECERRKTSPISGMVWRIGTTETPGGALALYFCPSLKGENDVREVSTALSREVRSAFQLILTGEGSLPVSESVSLPLFELVSLHDDEPTFVKLTDPHEVVGAPKKIQNGRPSPYAQKLAGLILPRIANGSAQQGRNDEARAIAQLYRRYYPEETQPSLPVIKRQVTKHRAGSKLD